MVKLTEITKWGNPINKGVRFLEVKKKATENISCFHEINAK